jgi:hypothetical protein
VQSVGAERTGVLKGHDAGKPALPTDLTKPPSEKLIRALALLASDLPALMECLQRMTCDACAVEGRAPTLDGLQKVQRAVVEGRCVTLYSLLCVPSPLPLLHPRAALMG